MKFTWSNSSSTAPGTKESWHAPLNKVTSLSKIVAAVVVIILPFLGFFLGLQFAGREQGAQVIQALFGY